MLESKDPGIKLFGKKIQLPLDGEIQEIVVDDLSSQSLREKEYDRGGVEEDEEKTEENSSSKKAAEMSQEEDDNPSPSLDESTDPEVSSETNVNPKTPSIEEENNAKSKTEKPQNGNSQDKTLKKPDKILPCPRCNSMDTKFCYYNNYNVNQPRHFCKACQRYWTAGGTMRNVPVGAGRRKNKNSSLHYRHISISEALQAARIDPPNGINFHHQHPHLKSNGRVLSFGIDNAPICDSMASVLNLAEKKDLNGCTRNGFHGPKARENGDDCSNGPSVSVSNSMDDAARNVNGFTSPVPCIPGIPWHYQWNTTVPPPPGFFPPGMPMPFYPVWNYAIPNVPWLSPAQQSLSPNSDSPKLGKHSRESDVTKSEDVNKPEATKQKNGSVLVPKTLRIDDPSEAAKSSIWKTLGIKNECISGKPRGGGLFKGLQPKSDDKSCLTETSSVLQANPAALSRSMKFHESS